MYLRMIQTEHGVKLVCTNCVPYKVVGEWAVDEEDVPIEELRDILETHECQKSLDPIVT